MRTRAIYIAAAVLAAAALVLPLWGFAMSAPQYPDETLHLQVQRTGIVGDVHEVTTLQHFIGVRFPTDMPELQWVTRAIAVFAALLLAGALVGTGTAGRMYRVLCAIALVAFLLASAGVVQARLYQVGHIRDSNAPMKSLHNFTPLLVGPTKVGNFTVWSYPHLGGLTLLAAAFLSVYGVRRKPATTDNREVRLHPDDGDRSGSVRLQPDDPDRSGGVRLQPDRRGKAVA